MNKLEIYSSFRREKIRHLLSLVNDGNFVEVLKHLDYCPGVFAAYYAVALICRLPQEKGEKLIAALNQRADPKPESNEPTGI